MSDMHSPAGGALDYGDWTREVVLVTGATGFIGGNLAAGLLRQGAQVITLERDRKARNTLAALGIADQVTVVSGSITDAALLERVFNEHEVTVCFHLAAQAIVGTANHSPLSTFESNIQGTWCVLEGARRCRTLSGVVVASSDKAYGVHETLPYTEEFRLNGRFPYDVSKVCTDVLAQSYHVSYGLPVAITRNANTYGPGDMNMSRLIPECIRSALQGRSFEIRSDGKMERDFMYVDDAVDGYLLLAKALARPGVAGEAFNFGTGDPRSVLEVTQKILELVGGAQKAPVVLNEARCEIPRQFLGIGKAERLWGWTPRVSLDEGLRKTVAWYREFLACMSHQTPSEAKEA